MYRPKRIGRIRLRISRKIRVFTAALAALVALALLLTLLFDDYDGYENIAKDRFQRTFDSVTASVLSEYNWDESKLPEAPALASCKADILDNLRDEMKGVKFELVSADRLIAEGRTAVIKLPRFVAYSSRISGHFTQDYCESGINMGVYTINFVAEAELTANDAETACTAECIIYRCFVEGEVPDFYYDDLFE